MSVERRRLLRRLSTLMDIVGVLANRQTTGVIGRAEPCAANVGGHIWHLVKPETRERLTSSVRRLHSANQSQSIGDTFIQ